MSVLLLNSLTRRIENGNSRCLCGTGIVTYFDVLIVMILCRMERMVMEEEEGFAGMDG